MERPPPRCVCTSSPITERAPRAPPSQRQAAGLLAAGFGVFYTVYSLAKWADKPGFEPTVRRLPPTHPPLPRRHTHAWRAPELRSPAQPGIWALAGYGLRRHHWLCVGGRTTPSPPRREDLPRFQANP